jgi:capsular exopolysaccharide synthesis family protein
LILCFVLVMSLYLASLQVETQRYSAHATMTLRVPTLREQYYGMGGEAVSGQSRGFGFATQLKRLEKGEQIYPDAADLVLGNLMKGEMFFVDRTRTDAEPFRVEGGERAFQKLLVEARKAYLEEGEGAEATKEAEDPLQLLRDDLSFRERVRDALKDYVRACQISRTDEQSQLVSVYAEMEDPLDAVVAINAVMQAAAAWDQKEVKERWRHEKAELSLMADETKVSLDQAQDEYSDHLRRKEVLDLEKSMNRENTRFNDLESRKESLQAQIVALDKEVDRIQVDRQFEKQYGEKVADRVSQLTSEKEQLEQERAALLIDFTPEHPQVKGIDARLGHIDHQLERARLEVAEQEEKALVRDLQKIKLDKMHLLQEIEETDARIAEQHGRLEELYTLNDETMYKRGKVEWLLTKIHQLTDELVKRDFAERTVEGSVQIERFLSSRDAHPIVKRAANARAFVILIAVVVSILCVYVMEYMDTRIKTEHDIRRYLNLPVLAKVPKQKEGDEVLMVRLPIRDRFAEIFNTAATLLNSTARDLGLKSFIISSTAPEEGKTTITLNLGVALARKGLRVILVDSDLRRPQLHDLLGLDNSFGLSSILEGRQRAREMLEEATGNGQQGSGVEHYLQPTELEHLKVLTSGPIPQDPISLLESLRMKALAEELKTMADFVLYDTPPIFNVGDALTLAPLADANLFVVGAMKVDQHQVTWAKHLMSNVEANIIGVFLNMEVIESRSYYYYYNYYKSYRYR